MNKTPNQSTASDSDLSMLVGSEVMVIGGSNAAIDAADCGVGFARIL